MKLKYKAGYDDLHRCWTVRYGGIATGYVCGMFMGKDGARFAKLIAKTLNEHQIKEPEYST